MPTVKSGLFQLHDNWSSGVLDEAWALSSRMHIRTLLRQHRTSAEDREAACARP